MTRRKMRMMRRKALDDGGNNKSWEMFQELMPYMGCPLPPFLHITILLQYNTIQYNTIPQNTINHRTIPVYTTQASTINMPSHRYVSTVMPLFQQEPTRVTTGLIHKFCELVSGISSAAMDSAKLVKTFPKPRKYM